MAEALIKLRKLHNLLVIVVLASVSPTNNKRKRLVQARAVHHLWHIIPVNLNKGGTFYHSKW